MKVGVFDSGVGGLSVLKSLLDARLFSSIVYYGDTARVPYGSKDKETIVRFCLEALEFFQAQSVDMLVIACNTASAYALDSLKKRASFPVIGVITPGVIATDNKIKDKDSQILVIATKATIHSNLYATKLQNIGFKNIQSLATGLFVPFVEERIFSGMPLEALFEYYFKNIITPPKALILGCTHFPLIADSLKNYFGNQTLLIHSGEAIAQYIQTKYNLVQNQPLENLEFYASDAIEVLKNTARLWLGKDYQVL